MSKLNVTGSGTGPLRTETVPSGKTHNAAPGYRRSAETELFMHATTRFFGEDSHYEDATVADERLQSLTRGIADSDRGWAWLCGFAPYLRRKENIRTAALVVAAEAVAARLEQKQAILQMPGWKRPLTNRQLLNAVQVRADEPAELCAWALNRYGRAIPMPFKRGIADGVTRLWDERAVLRYDKPDRPVRFADVLELCHPKIRVSTYTDVIAGEPVEVTQTAVWQGVLFRHLITARRGRAAGLDGKPYEPPVQLRLIRARWQLNKLPVDERHVFMRAVLEGDNVGEKQLKLAMAGQQEWLRSWLGGKND